MSSRPASDSDESRVAGPKSCAIIGQNPQRSAVKIQTEERSAAKAREQAQLADFADLRHFGVIVLGNIT
jgi:hypothetical protein